MHEICSFSETPITLVILRLKNLKKKSATQGKLRPPVELTQFSDKKDSFA